MIDVGMGQESGIDLLGIATWPTLYAANGGAGAMIRHHGDAVDIKLYNAGRNCWTWQPAAIVKSDRRKGIPLSPSLIVRGSSLYLGVPKEFSAAERRRENEERANEINPGAERVAAIDLGINKLVTVSIVDSEGTVIARRFFCHGAHIGRRDKVLDAIRKNAAKTMGGGGRLCSGFCSSLYARAAGFNTHIARTAARDIVAFALEFGATTLVFERLKGWRPKGGAKRSNLKKKFHGWLHRAVAKQAETKGREVGLHFATVPPRGTSSWAYDGSGKVVRERFNYGRCRFTTGKEYDTDLSAFLATLWQRAAMSSSSGNPDYSRKAA